MRLFLFLFLVCYYPLCCKSQPTKLPVLRVYFEGEILPDMDYCNGTMQLTDTDNSVVRLPAKFRTRGATVRKYLMKPSLIMKLRSEDYTEEADSALLSMRSCSSWILDAMAIDRICMRNRVAFDIWNEFSRLPYDTEFEGRNGTEGRFIELYINDQYRGIYCLTDRINRKLLNLKKYQEQTDGSVLVRGVLYKSGTMNIQNQNEPCYSEDSATCVVEWHNAWELSYPEEYGSAKVWQPLQDAILNGYNSDYVKRYFYLQNLADYQILVMALAISDNWGNKNRFFSIRNINKDINNPDPAESNRRKFVITPWDLDTSFGGHYEGEYYDGNYLDWPLDPIFNNAPYPYGPICADDEYLAILKQRWIEARRGAFSPSSIREKLERYRNLFLNSGAWQRMVDYYEKQNLRPLYVLDLSREISLINEWYQNRFRLIDACFGITDTEDGIEEIQNSKSEIQNDEIYDLAGRKVQGARCKGLGDSSNSQLSTFNSQLKKGVYIHRGKRISVR